MPNKLLALLLLVLLPTTTATAASAGVSGSMYEVEVLVFKSLVSELEGDELWTVKPVAEQAAQVPETPRYAAEQPLKADSALSKAAQRLGENNNYLIVTHKRWVVSAEAKSLARTLRIAEKESWDSELTGTLKFYVSRFFHLEVSLDLKESPDMTLAQNTETDALPQIYRIAEDRRIKTGDIHYFDHPKFGMLVQINPYR